MNGKEKIVIRKECDVGNRKEYNAEENKKV